MSLGLFLQICLNPQSVFTIWSDSTCDLCLEMSRMSRRRVSVRDLDPVDFQGWLYRKKEGKGFLGMKWKKYWFVLKKTSLYWYTNQMVSLVNADVCYIMSMTLYI